MERCRIVSVDILRFLATLLIFNHMAARFYGQWKFLATGGVLGCALFFFCSGYMLSLGRMDGFGAWYKRRLIRVWPTSFVATLLHGLFIGGGQILTAVEGGGWFVTCILIHYCAYYWMDKLFKGRKDIMMAASIVVSIIVYLLWEFTSESEYWVGCIGYIRWVEFFMCFMLGSFVSVSRNEERVRERIYWLLILCLFVISILLFYSCYIFAAGGKLAVRLHIVSFVPLLTFVFTAERLAGSMAMARFARIPTLNRCIVFLGGLSLEMFLVGRITTQRVPQLACPLGYVAAFVTTVAAAYFTRSLGRLFAQTFDKSLRDYDWKDALAI